MPGIHHALFTYTRLRIINPAASPGSGSQAAAQPVSSSHAAVYISCSHSSRQLKLTLASVYVNMWFGMRFWMWLQVYMWELRDRQRFGKARAERLPRENVNSDQARIRFALAPVAPAWRLGLVAASAAAPFIATLAAAWQDTSR